jgi:hypothetical protein
MNDTSHQPRRVSLVADVMRRMVVRQWWPWNSWIGRPGYWAYRLMQRYGPLGRCQSCRRETWNPVCFGTRLSAGTVGHYFCESCGPALLEAAQALGNVVLPDD